jgi:hypothetical protein
MWKPWYQFFSLRINTFPIKDPTLVQVHSEEIRVAPRERCRLHGREYFFFGLLWILLVIE